MLRDGRPILDAGAGIGLLVGVALVWRALVFPPEPASTPIRFVHRPKVIPASPAELPAPPTDTAGVARLLFAGDIMQHRLQAEDDFSASYAGIAPVVRRADLAIANLEFPVDTTRPIGPPPGSTTFNGSVRHLDAIAAAGFDLLQTANNHALDQGPTGVVRTWETLRSRGPEPVGTAPTLAELEQSPVVVREAGGLRFGFVAYTIVPNRYRNDQGRLVWLPRDAPVFALNFGEWDREYRQAGTALFREHARLARMVPVDFLVALVHWGEEWGLQPTEDQRRAARDLVDAGFDLVVGGHSHVLNPAEVYRGHLIAYSLGDLITDFQPYQTRTGALLDVSIVKGSYGPAQLCGFAWYPTLVERHGHRIRFVGPGADTDDREAWDFARRALGPGARVPEKP